MSVPLPLRHSIGGLGQKPILLGALLALLTVLLYAPVTHNGFLDYFDDDSYVAKNIHVSTGFSLGNALWAFTSFYQANWHPLTWLSHMADCQLFGLNPGLHHLVNVILHALNVLMLFLLLQRATGAVWRSLLVAALFAVHPLNVETVAWVAERKSLLSAFFSLLTIAAYGWYIRRSNRGRYLVVLVAFSLALMSKPMAVSLPLVLLLLDYWPLERYEGVPFRRKWLKLSAEKFPLLLLSAASSLVTMVAQRSAGAVAGASELPFSWRLENAAVSYPAYIGKTFWPANLAVFYPHSWHSVAWPDMIAATTVLATITLGVLYFHEARYLAVGWFLFLMALVPVIGIVQVGRQAMADRYAYVPCVGLFIIIAWSLRSIVHATALPRVVSAAAALCLVLAFAAVTSRYLSYWHDGVKLFTKARIVAGRPDFVIEEGLAESLAATGRLNEALPHYREACTLFPNYARCHYKMAELLFDRGQFVAALEEYQFVESRTDSNDITLLCAINSGEILLDLGNYESAEMEIAAALKIDPNNSRALALRQRALDQKAAQTAKGH